MSALAPWAVSEARSRGRAHRERSHAFRGEYQRDRDRIIHSAAFRRLEYKTQVFVNHEGDMFRTRLTHTLEVAQISRTIARALALNEDLVEAIALAHDLGHTPFGHAGQRALDECMHDHGRFEHNFQSLRVVDRLETPYADFDGLNLTYETREGILKRCLPEDARRIGDLGRRFLEGGQPSLEAQLANLADGIAYNNHDVDDGLRAGLLDIDTLLETNFFREEFEAVRKRWPGLAEKRSIRETIRAMIDRQGRDLVEASRLAIEKAAPADVDDIRARRSPLIRFGEEMDARQRELRELLHRGMYNHPRVHRMAKKAGSIIHDLFDCFFEDPLTLPLDIGKEVARIPNDDPAIRARIVSDYIAGMTDRFAIAEHARLFSPGVLP